MHTSRIKHRTIAIDGMNIFYRDAGPHDAPVLLLLHGFPSSSHQYVGLMDRLSDRVRLIAPDYPGSDIAMRRARVRWSTASTRSRR
jgi:pimeloyl-ACP methyl ester carboxylesterase